MKITEALVVLFLVLFCYLFLDKFLFRGELGEICFGPTCRALARWHRRQADRLDPPRRRRRRTAAVTPKDDALVVTRDYGAGQRTPARAASRHSRRKGNNSDKSDHTFVPASDSDKEHRAVQATVQGWIHKEPTALTAEEENTLMREAATEEVMDIGCERRPRLPGRRVSLRSSWIASSPCARGRPCLKSSGKPWPECCVTSAIRKCSVHSWTPSPAPARSSPVIWTMPRRKRRSVWLPLRNRLFNLKNAKL